MNYYSLLYKKKRVIMTSLHQTFGKFHNPRINRKKRHLFLDIIILRKLLKTTYFSILIFFDLFFNV